MTSTTPLSCNAISAMRSVRLGGDFSSTRRSVWCPTSLPPRQVSLLFAFLLCFFASVSASAGAQAQPPAANVAAGMALAPRESDASARFAAISAERDAMTTQRLNEERDCYQRFAVNGCLADVRDRFAPVKAELRRRDLGVRNDERARKESERLARVEQASANDLRNAEAARQRATNSVPVEKRQADQIRREADRNASQPMQLERARADLAHAQATVDQAARQRERRIEEAPTEQSKFDAKQRAAAARIAASESKDRDRSAKLKNVVPLATEPKPAQTP